MNDESNQLERRLEQATASQLPAGTPLDSETAALREGWLALGQLLEAVESASVPASPLPAQPPSPQRRSWKVPGIVASLAASLLVAAVLARGLFPVKTSEEQAVRPPAPAQTAPAQPVEPLRVTERNLAGSPATAKSPTAQQSSWDETVDDNISQAYQNFMRIEQDWNACDAISASVSTRLEEMAQELAKSTI